MEDSFDEAELTEALHQAEVYFAQQEVIVTTPAIPETITHTFTSTISVPSPIEPAAAPSEILSNAIAMSSTGIDISSFLIPNMTSRTGYTGCSITCMNQENCYIFTSTEDIGTHCYLDLKLILDTTNLENASWKERADKTDLSVKVFKKGFIYIELFMRAK